LDVEVSASGVTRQMERDLNIEMGIENDDDDDDDNIGSEEVEKELESVIESSEVEDLRKNVEDMLNNEFRSEVQNKYNEEPSINTDLQSDTDKVNMAVVATRSDSTNSEMLQAEEALKVERNPHLSTDDVNNEDECIHERIRLYSSTCSMRSTSTAATIAPEEIRSRVKKSLEQREKSAFKKRITVKGEASAITRSRRENMDTIKQCDGIWGWE
jgi:RIO kinase 2